MNDEINALYDLRHDQATEEAKASEKRYQSGNPISPFDGVPVTLKDSVNAVGMKWFHGTVIHGDTGIVGQKDSPPAARLKEAGAIIIGKAAMPDFGLSGSGVSGSHGIVRNPWGLYWSTGGSSAGGGASLASGIGMMVGGFRHCGLRASSGRALRLGRVETNPGGDSSCACLKRSLGRTDYALGGRSQGLDDIA